MHGGDLDFRMPPTQLPFPINPQQQPMYDCQDVTDDEEKKLSDADALATASTKTTTKLSDPPLQSPFLDLESVSDELKQVETNNWFIMKFPTRLPHLDNSLSSTNASKGGATAAASLVKSELSEEAGTDIFPDAAGSSSSAASKVAADRVGSAARPAAVASGAAAATMGATSPSAAALGYDDTLKDTASGRYGRIEVRKSGKTELVLGGGDGSPEVRLLIHEGLQCGFRQEAVCIDPDEATFVVLGDVDKSLIVTPDVERAFVFS